MPGRVRERLDVSREAAGALLRDVSHETKQRLEAFVALLLRWNGTVNLIARGDESAVWQRHISDSLQLIPLIQAKPSRAIDFGSGAGFPGLVVALATGIHFDLIEADQRKAAFLREAIRVTGTPASVHPVRAETAAIEPAPLLTARAVAPLPALVPLAERLLSPSGVCLFHKGANVEVELTAASRSWQMHVERLPSRTSRSATILRISEIRRASVPD
jgi:16S rRNA (guanine527-N7)-methyltransferase